MHETRMRRGGTTELELLFASHRLVERLLRRGGDCETEGVIFLDFRPHWLHKQVDVYRAMPTQTCSICMHDCFVERIARQHNQHHPPVCRSCLSRLVLCPFCRAWLPRRGVLPYPLLISYDDDGRRTSR
jgi:hypothetical protein